MPLRESAAVLAWRVSYHAQHIGAQPPSKLSSLIQFKRKRVDTMIQNSSLRPYLVTAALTLLIASSLAMASSSNKWRLQFSGGAHSNGVIVLEFSPIGGEPLRVEIPVTDGTSENHVAKVVTNRLREYLPDDAYHVERDDGEDVLVKKRHGAANFAITVVSNTVKHVRINLDRE